MAVLQWSWDWTRTKLWWDFLTFVRSSTKRRTIYMDRKLDMKDMEAKIHREGAQGGQHRSHRPLSISIVSLNGELIHAQRETERGWEKRGKKNTKENHCWFTPAVKVPSSLWLVYFRHGPWAQITCLQHHTPAHHARNAAPLATLAWESSWFDTILCLQQSKAGSLPLILVAIFPNNLDSS